MNTRWSPPLWFDRLSGIAWRAVIVTVALALAITGLMAMSAVILPLVLGLLFACALRPVAGWLRRARVPNGLAALAAVLLLLVAIGAVAWFTVTAVVDQWGEIERLVEEARATLVDEAADAGIDTDTANDADESVSSLVTSITDLLLGGLVQIIPTAAGVTAAVLLSMLVTFFFLKDGPDMWSWIVVRLGDEGSLVDRVGRRVWGAITGFILGQAAIAAIDAALITLGAIVLGVPNAGAIFMLTFFGAFIPYIGAFLSGLVAVLLAVGDGGVSQGVAMLVVIIAVQVLEGNALQPWIQGKAVNLHPLVIALSVAAGGALAGFLGVFLAVPIAAATFVTLAELRAAGIIGPFDATESGATEAGSGRSP